MPPEKHLTPNQVAELLNVSPVTVRHWALNGKLKFITTPGGHRRFAYADIEAFARQHGAGLSQGDNALRILVVDDNVELAGLMAEMLTAQVPDVLVDIAHDGFAAGEKIHTFKPAVVLLDLMMPGLDGFETCRRIKMNAATCHVRVLAMTGYPSEENVQRILAQGAEVCLAKPVRAPVLLQAIGINTQQDLKTHIS